jgi:hypothetical protein
MAAINRRSLICPIGTAVALATADDLDGVQDLTKTYDITGALRVLVMQFNDGTAGTAGIDCIEVSHDGGSEWYADDGTAKVGPGLLLLSADDDAGSIVAGGALNAAGIEPATVRAGLFKAGPYEGPTLIRLQRDTSVRGTNGTGTDWVTGAPSVDLVPIGLPAGGGAISAEA